MTIFYYFTVFSVCLFFNLCSGLPNFVILLADDLGIGDVGCFGNTTMRTPNIDALAAKGAMLTHHLAAASVCTPSRAALLTGRYPVRMGMESSGRNKVFLFVAQSGGLPPGEMTIAKALKSKGYATAIVGKWHLGNDCKKQGDMRHHPLNHGFDKFYGLPLSNFKDLGGDGQSVITNYIPHFYKYFIYAIIASLASIWLLYAEHKKFCIYLGVATAIIPPLVLSFLLNLRTLNGVLMRDERVVEQPVRLPGLTQRLIEEAEDFIELSVARRKPFFLYLPFVHVHTALFTSVNFTGNNTHGDYGDNVEELDWAVGRVRKILKKYGVAGNTFIYFSSDNGGHLEDYGKKGRIEGGSNGIYRGGKTIAGYDGGIRVPTIITWPGKVSAGLKITAMTSQMDLFVTILEIVKGELPENRIIDGKSLLPLLRQETRKSQHEILFHYCGKRIHAATYIPEEGLQIWKIHWKTPRFLDGTIDKCGYVCHCFGAYIIRHEPPLLYNLYTDPSEIIPLNVSEHLEYIELVRFVGKLRDEHAYNVIHVNDQFGLLNAIWKPWLQPCCNFPYCLCTEYKYAHIA